MTYGNYPNLDFVKKILVIKLRNVGDVLLTTPVLQVLKRRFPEAKMDAYINQEAYPILQGNPYLSQCFLYDRKQKKSFWLARYGYEYQLLKNLRKQRYDLVINLTEGDRGTIVSKICRAPIRVGMDSSQGGFWGKQKIYTHLVKTCPTPRHTVEKNLDALRKIGIHPAWEDRELYLSLGEEEQNHIDQELYQRKISSFLLIHPTARWKFKCWPEAQWKKLIFRLLSKGYSLVVSSGKEEWEKKMVEEMLTPFQGKSIWNAAGQLTLGELAVLIDRSLALLCVDSAPFHMASALKHKVVALFGPTSPVLWGPWRNPHSRVVGQDYSCRPCLQDGCGGSKKSDCLETLSEIKVYRELQHLLGAESHSKNSSPR